MSFEITTAFSQQYGDNVLLLSQQKSSRLRSAVYVEQIEGKSAYIDQVGSVTAQRITNRHGDSPLNSTPHRRRKLNLVDYDTGDLIDRLDKVKTLIDPTNSYAMAHAAAMGRAMDDEIIGAAFADMQTGEDGSTTVAFPSSNQVAVNSWKYGSGSGNAGLTVSKIIEAKQILDGNDVDPDEERFAIVGSKQIANLLATTEVTSADYNNVKALVEGKVDTFGGFKFIRSERLLTDGSGYRRCIFFAKNGLALGIGSDVVSRITERADKRFSMYAYFQMSICGARLEEAKVVEVKCLES